MGNRILKESICTSLQIDALTWFEEVFFYRLIVQADDYGVCHADPVLLAHALFPRKESVTRKMVEEALSRLEQLDLIRRYSVAGKGVFLRLTSWDRHQRLRCTRRKYPAPEEAAEEAPGEPAEPEPPPPFITLPLNDGTEYPVTREDVEEYAALYRAVDVEEELRAMRGWCLGNEKKRKTKYGVKRFINGWLARARDRGGTQAGTPAAAGRPYTDNPYLAMECEGAVE